MWSCTQWESLWGEAQAQIGEVGLQLQLCEGWHHTDRHSCSSVHVHRAGWRLRRCNRPLDADTGLACIWYTLGLGRLTWVSQFRPVSVARSSVSAETETLPWLRDRNRNRSRNCASGSFGAETETETEIRSASNSRWYVVIDVGLQIAFFCDRSRTLLKLSFHVFIRVTTCLEKLEMSDNLTAVRKCQGFY